jgi:ATP-dependent Clp protease adaptor protein ClpS
MVDDNLKLNLKCSIKIIVPLTMSEGDKPNEDNVGGNIKLETNPKTKIPALYRVLMMNDDYTPMEFVIEVLEKFFQKNR